ncbi:DUF3329 domain-containing protein [Rhizobiaceae bacterium BDR2-2]|uniref:DUF3329 domain-containing protein n=1 Tax=Ectorhizobium quercum TaxID=2965071 RepID=A0AAE3N1D9_9HYPH|nr:DUF3329 domain-containing protein [Ectorhizobium quercum]MCX8997515.1 DUF3329 domain-containing protein [Ectorhizobium quercum]
MSFLDRHHPFFKPLWRRALTVAAPVAWSIFEVASGSVGWGILFFAAGAYAAWELFIAPEPAKEETLNDNGKAGDEP